MSMSAATEQIMFDKMVRARKHGKYSLYESNYERLFGTPERAAQTLLDMCKCAEFCDYCPLYGQGVEHCEFPDAKGSVLEWLKGTDA